MERPRPHQQYPLLPGERLERIESHPEHSLPHAQPSALKQLLRLTAADKPRDIGTHGPAIASLSLETESGADHLHLYETVFGRDSLHVARDLIDEYPELARTTVYELAKLQGVDTYEPRREEPGRIVHEARHADDPIARKLTDERGWQWPFYGSVDATPEFIRTLVAYCQQSEENHSFLAEPYTDRHHITHSISYALEMAVTWVLTRLDMTHEGFIEYRADDHEAWRDSWDGYHDTKGHLADPRHGIVSTDVQISAYDALCDAAELFEDVLGLPDEAEVMRERAAQLRTAIFSLLWTNEKGGYFILGAERTREGALKPLGVRASNMGHALNSRLLDGNDPEIVRMRSAVVAQLSSPEMLAAGGIRTLASDEVRFRPGAYHNGSVWLWDTYYIAQGLLRHGYVEFANDLCERLLRDIQETGMFPEYIRGEAHTIAVNTHTIILWDEIAGRENKVEQPPQEVQAWTVAAILAIKRHLTNQLAPTRGASAHPQP